MNCLMFDSEERGVLVSGGTPWTDEQIARATRGEYLTNLRDIAELLDMGVAFRDNRGAIFCKRMVRDEQERIAAKKRKRQSRLSHTLVTRKSPIETATANESVFEVDVGSKKFIKPSLEEVTEYVHARGDLISPEAFYDFYESVGWKIGNKPMKKWHNAVGTWERRIEGKSNGTKRQQEFEDAIRRAEENAESDAGFPKFQT